MLGPSEVEPQRAANAGHLLGTSSGIERSGWAAQRLSVRLFERNHLGDNPDLS